MLAAAFQDHGAVVMAEPGGGPGTPHRPVLLIETISLLTPERGGLFVDATLGTPYRRFAREIRRAWYRRIADQRWPKFTAS